MYFKLLFWLFAPSKATDFWSLTTTCVIEVKDMLLHWIIIQIYSRLFLLADLKKRDPIFLTFILAITTWYMLTVCVTGRDFQSLWSVAIFYEKDEELLQHARHHHQHHQTNLTGQQTNLYASRYVYVHMYQCIHHHEWITSSN